MTRDGGSQGLQAGAARQRRCEAAIAMQPVDRAPAMLLGMACSVASQILGRRAYAGTTSLHWAEALAWSRGNAAHAEFEARLHQDLLDLHRALDLDVWHPPWRLGQRPAQALDEHTFVFGDPQGWHTIWRYEQQSGQFWKIKDVAAPLLSPEERALRQLAATQAAAPGMPQSCRRDVAGLVNYWRRLESEFFLVTGAGGLSVGHDEESLLALATEPDAVRQRLLLNADSGIAWMEALAQSPCPKAVLGGGDLASYQGPLYSPTAFRHVVLPAYQRLVGRCNELGIHYVFRSDGNIWPLADMLFRDAACPGYGEADREAGMTAGKIRQRYPRLVIWGNVGSAFLQRATVSQVRDEAKRVLDETGGLGYFQGCSNVIVKGTPPDNVLALFSVRS